MIDEPRLLPEADANMPSSDWFGSAVAQERKYGGENDLVGLAGLDPQRWIALAIDLYFDTNDQHEDVFLYVADVDDFQAAKPR